MKLFVLGILATTVWTGGCPPEHSRVGNKCCFDLLSWGSISQCCWCGETDYDDCWNGGGCEHECHNHHDHPRTCSCHDGYYLSGTRCYNYDECDNNTDDCHTHARCTDQHPDDGKWSCKCKDGYDDDGTDGTSCSNRNECTHGPNNCHIDAICTDKSLHTDGQKFSCACKDGYDGSGRSCSNINECTEGGNNCHADAICTDKAPTVQGVKFSCQCKSGFDDNGDGTHCTDRNECTNGEDRCDPVAMCTNTHGDHTCECPLSYLVPGDSTTMAIGYTDPNQDGTVCEDIDECAENPCHDDAVCTNTIGSYHCDCNEGHQGEGHECTLCHAESTWSTEGDDVTAMNAECTCNTGYEGDGDVCEDIVECDVGTDNCDPNSTCTNTIGSHYCTCNVGYYGLGETCTVCDPETHLDEMEFECSSDGISGTIPYCAFYNEDITNHSFLGTGENCTMKNTGINVEISIPTTSECGTTVTKNGTYLVYSNAIVGDVLADSGAVSRKKVIDLDFQCGFDVDVDLSSDNAVRAMLDHVEIQLDRQNTQFDIEMGVFTDDTFTELVHEDYSVVVPDIINTAVQLMDGESALVLLAKKCWATPSSDPEDETQYVFLDNFCSTIDGDGVVNIGQNGVDREVQFELQSFEFDGHADGTIYLHCHAHVCDTEIADCSVDCSESGRRRRSNYRTPRSIGETSSPLRVGPIRVIAPNH